MRVHLFPLALASGLIVAGAAAAPRPVLPPGVQAQVSDDFGDFDDLGNLDDEEFLSGDPSDFGDDVFDEGPGDPFDDPFDPFDEPLPAVDGPGDPADQLSMDDLEVGEPSEVGVGLTAFADLLAELRSRGVARPFHGLTLLRLRKWVGAGELDLVFADEEPGLLGNGRVDALLAVAENPSAPLPADEVARLEAFRGGLPELTFDEDFSASLPLEDDPEAPWFEIEDDLEFPDFESPPARSLDPDDPVNPFRIYRERNKLAARLFRPLDAAGWVEWLAQAEESEGALVEGLGEVVGTIQGREELGRALRLGVSTTGARLIARVVGEHGSIEDLDLLQRLEARHPSARYDVQLARGRIQERQDKHLGLDQFGREAAARQLIQQAQRMAEREDWGRAVRFASEAAEVAPDPRGPQYSVARYAYQIGWYQKAREALEAAMTRGVSHHAYFTTYAKMMRRQGRRDELIPVFERALERADITELKVRLCNELALEYAALGNGREAVKLAKIGMGYFVPPAVRDNLLTRYGEGMTLMGRLPEASRAFESALRIDPSYRKARTGLAAVQALQGMRQ